MAGDYCIFKKCRSRSCLSFILVHVLALLASMQLSSSQSIVRTLPGYKGDLPFKLETGYVGVGEADSVQLFYYFIESQGEPRKDPLLLWLSGGPGCSGFYPLVYEIGPLNFNVEDFDGNFPTLVKNKHSWTKTANIIFLDAPVGTGFSYASDPSSYNVSDTISANQTYEFLRKWLMYHPSFLSNELYIGGDGYSGMIVPLVVKQIYDGNVAGRIPRMKLIGYILGNPVTDKHAEYNSRVKYAFLKNLISQEMYESAKANCGGEYLEIDPDNLLCINDTLAIFDCTAKLNFHQILEPKCEPITSSKSNGIGKLYPNSPEENPEHLLLSLSSLRIPRPWCRVYNYLLSYIWANDIGVQEALHVREGTIGEWAMCNNSLLYDSDVNSTVDYHRILAGTNLRSLIYSGDHDMIVTYTSTSQWIKSLDMRVKEAWQPWFIDGQVAGYTTKYQRGDYIMTFTTVKGAGHTAPEYRPKESFAMAYRWLAHFDI